MKQINLFTVIMVVLICIVLILAILFPFKKYFQAKNDRLIEYSLDSLTTDINNYYSKNDKLPENLESLDTNVDGVKLIIDKDLVKYRVIENNALVDSTDSAYSYTYSKNLSSTEGRYEVCVNYKFEKEDAYSTSQNTEEYRTYIDSYYHPAGEVCYKMRTN